MSRMLNYATLGGEHAAQMRIVAAVAVVWWWEFVLETVGARNVNTDKEEIKKCVHGFQRTVFL